MTYLSVKLDHIATLRERRKVKTPEPAQAAVLAEMAGADSITVHLRSDRRHVRDRDLYILREIVRTRLTVEIAPVDDLLNRVVEVKPYMVIFVPEIDREITTQNGLQFGADSDAITRAVARVQEAGIRAGVHIDPDLDAVKHAGRLGVDCIRFHTGAYVNAETEQVGLSELDRIERAARAAYKSRLVIGASSGLTLDSLPPLLQRGIVDEVTVGYNLVARSALVGMPQAVSDYLQVCRREFREGKI